MLIPETQLETWSRQGAISSSKATHEGVRVALTAPTSPIRDRILSGEVDVYLQGSYKNDTNIRGDSDVDIVVELESIFYSNLSEAQKQSLGLTTATYTWPIFRQDVIRALTAYYGAQLIDTTGNKSIKIRASSGRLAADAVPCFSYRNYRDLNAYAVGMTFWTQRENRQVINYPKIHYQNGVKKNSDQETNGWYKPSVRMFKNARTYMIDQRLLSAHVAPSYFLECLVFNVPNDRFGRSFQGTYCGVVNYLNEANLSGFICQNGQLPLFGVSTEQWSEASARQFIQALISLWNNF